MKRNAMGKNLIQSILRSLGRYVAIVAIIALGAALFVGLLMTKTDMVATGQHHVDQKNMFDLRLVNSYGWAQEQVEKAAELDGISGAEGVFYIDLVARMGDKEEESVNRFYTIPEKLNQVSLRQGRMPEKDNECLADGFGLQESLIGSTVRISQNNDEDSLDVLNYKTYTVVGFAASPLYMDMNRGTTSVGNGTISNIFYVPAGAMDADYYSELHLTIPGAHSIYSKAYNDTLDAAVEAMEPHAEALAMDRFQGVVQDAEDAYDEGMEEYLDGVKEFEEGKAEAEQELADAYQELLDAEQTIKETKQKLANSERALIDARTELDANERKLLSGRETLAAQKKETFAMLDSTQAKLTASKAALESGGQSLDALYSSVLSVESGIAALNAQIGNLDTEAEDYAAQKAALEARIGEIKTQAGQLWTNRESIKSIYLGLQALPGQRAKAESEFAKSEKEIAANLKEIESARETIKKNITKVYNGKEELKKAKEDLEEGWVEYYDGKAEAEQEIADAEAELADAKRELEEARADIDALEPPDVFVLDRNSNIGYNSLDSSSDIVAGVSRVFPVFFLLVASLVCITTMTRMIDEERTQIGTLKALGYSNQAIISKYMIYAGSATIIGCGMGVFLGSTIMPSILWQAYSIMLYIQPEMVLTVDWVLCVIVISAYVAVMLFVTWYCCRRTLQEEPAELIRPKAPDAGKELLVEKLPFWHKISFLNKVTIRNIFRYRQRLAMMLVGIGGCTALLVTGFGLRDSIVNVVDYQFQDVTTYDMQVYFNDPISAEEEQSFVTEVADLTDAVMAYHQSSVELDANNQVKEIYMICGNEGIQTFIDLHSGEMSLPFPGVNDVVLSIGVAEAMGIGVGDTIQLRDSDMNVLELTVSGIYDNYVYNYAIVNPKTLEAQWEEAPGNQMAFVKVPQGQDVHNVSAKIADMDNVMNVSVSEDLASMVSRMMEALDLVVIVVVFCAGLLAVIVLYNLTNINITERIREIATIKVLGFNASETSAYVFKENITLTVVGTVLGLFLGKLLLAFVMSQVKIDMVWFKDIVMPMSYVWAVVLTILSAMIVNFIFYFKLEKINMAEALKSVE